MNKRFVIGALIIVVCLVVAFTAFEDSLTAYVTFDKARRSEKDCQVMGEIDREQVAYDVSSGTLRFSIRDESDDSLLVYYTGTVPGNFEQAKSVVAIGRYHSGRFEAKRLLVKCPSKYQGLQEQGEVNPHSTEITHDGT